MTVPTATAAPPAGAPAAPATSVPGLKQVVLVAVKTPTGGEIEVQGDGERRRYEEGFAAYVQNVTFTEHSDLEDLERILFMELMCYRWGRFLAAGREYDGTLITNEADLRRWVGDYMTQITKLKESLKLDRRGREGDRAATFEEQWRKLAEHAREMGVMREQQLDRALEIMQGLFGIVAAFDRGDEEERKKLGFPDAEAVLQYIRESRPVFDDIDAHFRANSQRYWVRKP